MISISRTKPKTLRLLKKQLKNLGLLDGAKYTRKKSPTSSLLILIHTDLLELFHHNSVNNLVPARQTLKKSTVSKNMQNVYFQ